MVDVAALQRELDALSATIGCAVSVDDPNGQLLSYSSAHGQGDDVHRAAIRTGHVSPEVRRWQDSHGIAGSLAAVRLPAKAELGVAARLCVPLRSRKRVLGYLWVVEPGRALHPGERDAADRAGAAVASLLRASATSDTDGLVRRLLTGSTMDRVEAWELLTAADPSLAQRPLRVCVAALTGRDRDGARALPPGVLARIRDERRDRVGTFGTAMHAVALTGVAGEPFAISGAELVLGYSDPAPFSPDAGVVAYRQASSAAHVAAVDPFRPRVLSWDALGIYRLLLSLPAEQRDAAAGPVRRLVRADDKGALVPTLETYLECGCDATVAARRLHLHRTSLYYRLGRVAEVLGTELRGGFARAELHVALKALRLWG